MKLHVEMGTNLIRFVLIHKCIPFPHLPGWISLPHQTSVHSSSSSHSDKDVGQASPCSCQGLAEQPKEEEERSGALHREARGGYKLV